MSLAPRAIALQGIGYAPALIALQGLADVAPAQTLPTGGSRWFHRHPQDIAFAWPRPATVVLPVGLAEETDTAFALPGRTIRRRQSRQAQQWLLRFSRSGHKPG